MSKKSKKSKKSIIFFLKIQKSKKKNPKPKNVKNCQKIIFLFFQKFNIFEEEKNYSKKKYSLFLNIRNMQFDQSSPVQPNSEKENLEKSEQKKFKKNPKILKYFVC